jgi:E1A/CREB-binding protein
MLFPLIKLGLRRYDQISSLLIYQVPGADSLVIRVVASVDKILEVKPRFLDIFREDNYSSEFPYKSKVQIVYAWFLFLFLLFVF